MGRPKKMEEAVTRSFTIDKKHWDKAAKRGKREGLIMSEVMRVLTLGYAVGAYDLPETVEQKMYPDKQDPAEVAAALQAARQ